MPEASNQPQLASGIIRHFVSSFHSLQSEAQSEFWICVNRRNAKLAYIDGGLGSCAV
jgi:hypothetical protein